MNQDEDRRRMVAAAFVEIFGEAPLVWARAPGRVDLMGSHTDYNLGCVLTLPISRDVWIATRPRSDTTVRVHSLKFNAQACFTLDRIEPDPVHPWSNYVRGVAVELIRAGLQIGGCDAVIHSTVPVGSGLSSSAALECAAAMMFQARLDRKLSAVETALLCQRAENRFVGVGCGILDQYTSCLGQTGCALLLDCRSLTHRTAPFPAWLRVVICDTRASRDLAASEYGSRRAQCEEGARRMGLSSLRDATTGMLAAADLPDAVRRRCRFIIEENDRVLRLAEALENGDAASVRELCGESFRGARDLYEICSPPMSAMMDAMLAAPGVIGARQAGAGFGGCMVAFVHAACVQPFEQAVSRRYASGTGIVPSVYPVEAAGGASIMMG